MKVSVAVVVASVVRGVLLKSLQSRSFAGLYLAGFVDGQLFFGANFGMFLIIVIRLTLIFAVGLGGSLLAPVLSPTSQSPVVQAKPSLVLKQSAQTPQISGFVL